ncbi:hypothetical protein LOY91_006710 [Ophidiomyces ophidiicola]|nr:hypothetical protein LOY91_006710 [Ophidiomyces ophidiicola]
MATNTAPTGPLPSAFDTTIGNNSFATQSCGDFFRRFLANTTFRECLPVSLLLATSKSWFNAAKSFVSLTRALDASCAVDAAKCAALLSQFNRELVSKDVCSKDLDAQNPLALNAQTGFVAYQFVHDAACLKNPDTGSYCMADALASEATVANTFVYHIALGAPLPGSTRPECNKCLQATMEVYSRAAANKDQPLAKTYLPTAQQINIGCGPAFVSERVKSAALPVSASRSPQLYLALPLLALMTLFLEGFL